MLQKSLVGCLNLYFIHVSSFSLLVNKVTWHTVLACSVLVSCYPLLVVCPPLGHPQDLFQILLGKPWSLFFFLITLKSFAWLKSHPRSYPWSPFYFCHMCFLFFLYFQSSISSLASKPSHIPGNCFASCITHQIPQSSEIKPSLLRREDVLNAPNRMSVPYLHSYSILASLLCNSPHW